MKLALFFFTTFWFSFFSFGQKNSSPALEARLIRGISTLIENNQTVPLAELNNQLKEAVGRKRRSPRLHLLFMIPTVFTNYASPRL